jgi:type II secretory ATPase GspE/PulE/Tfp pilus assembly ATPase PilB-like protein
MSFHDHSQTNFGTAKRFRIIIREAGQANSREMAGEELSHAVQIVDNVFINALESGASDIHIQPERDQHRIRLRQDGVLHDISIVPAEEAQSVISRIKLAAGMRIDEQREPQDGRIDMEFSSRRLSARVSCVPCLNGEKIVMRILDPAAMKVDLTKLGMDEHVLAKWVRAVTIPHGLILVTGPTGSGKSSTLYASVLKLEAKRTNIVTVEDPIEYEFDDHIAQVQVTEKMPFARVMRAFLRQDPDVMMVGEMRDGESLGIAIQAGLTGHLVMSTLHTNSALETVGRMFDMGAEPYLAAGVVNAILAQRLVRLNCAKCRQPYRPSELELEQLGLLEIPVEQMRFAKGAGCSDCRQTGYKGRIGVFELLLGTPEVRACIARGGDQSELVQHARSQGFRTMLEDGAQKAAMGWTTPEEVVKAVYTHAID